MLFNSYVFMLGFLPVVLLGYSWIGGHLGRRAALTWLTLASFFFYGWWNPAHLPLLLTILVFNFFMGRALSKAYRTNSPMRRALLVAGVSVDLAVLGYFKYAVFILDNVGALSGLDYSVQAIILPLGISFYTFQMIAYLADAAGGKTAEHDFIDYCLFVAFFPQLIAGPIVHHHEMMSQFERPVHERLTASSFALGVTYFTIGLFKKVMIADNLAPHADAAFASIAAGEPMGAVAAWRGALAYTFQLYFDFSGYSDMAIGLGLMFGIRLPFNFNSPYKATSIIDFWRRWHITLSRFLRDYVYVPLGGNRRGRLRRYVNLLATMTLGGLWHGAAWTFVVWGLLHGLYLIVNHAWLAVRERLGLTRSFGMVGTLTARGLTFMAIIVGWVFFRATSFEAATDMLQAMAGVNGLTMDMEPVELAANAAVLVTTDAAETSLIQDLWLLLQDRSTDVMLACLLVVAWFFPNSHDIIESRSHRSGWFSLRWQPTPAWAACVAACLLATMTQMSKVSAFLYFQF
jgi:D-alanyl-lipoteichoic acid acyltransferase DltB (MBOAT superfamily)